jgi:hypothetical protein
VVVQSVRLPAWRCHEATDRAPRGRLAGKVASNRLNRKLGVEFLEAEADPNPPRVVAHAQGASRCVGDDPSPFQSMGGSPQSTVTREQRIKAWFSVAG